MDTLSDNRYLIKRITPLVQRVLKPNISEKESNDIEQENKTALFMIRDLIDERRISLDNVRVCTRPTESIPELQDKIKSLLAENDLLRNRIETLETGHSTSASPPPPSSMPALRVLDTVLTMDKASVKLRKNLMIITNDSAEDGDVEDCVGEAKFTIQTWYRYRRGSISLPDLTPAQSEVIELMDAIYLSFMDHNIGRKQVQDILNKWWKSVYPGGKITLQGKDDPSCYKIVFNSKGPD